MKILSLGEIIWDVYPDKKCIGGAPLNFAAHMALLGNESFLLSAVGGDELAAPAMEALEHFGVRCDLVRAVSDKATGKCLVSLNDRGVPSYDLQTDTAYDYLSADGVTDGFDALCFGTLIQRSEQNVKVIRDVLAKRTFSHVLCDLNLRKPFYNREALLLCAENATILKISREELAEACLLLLKKKISAPAPAARALSAAFGNLKLIIITLDSDGAFVFDTREKRSYFSPAKASRVVSTVGAGDSFSAAFLSSYAADGDINKALDNAISLSSFVVSRAEAIPEK
jgi:fructokinase